MSFINGYVDVVVVLLWRFVQGVIAANGETAISLTLTPMTVGPMQETVQVTVAGVEDLILVKQIIQLHFSVVFQYF